ncbi:MAG: class A beta-lactamase [Pseudomonadota bacterium]
MIKRRFFTSFAGIALGGFASKYSLALTANPGSSVEAVQARLRELEASVQGRLGVYMVDSATGRAWSYRADERFMMLSSFKLLASALVLYRVDQGRESLDRRILYSRSDLVTYSPVTEKHADGTGMSLAELCEATITTSDNTAANLILASYGGPPAVTAFARQLGDQITRLDRIETDLNVGKAESLLDTSSPRAMAETMQKLVLGNVLSTASRERLQQWLLANTTGGKRLKAGLPADWKIGDKTGTNKSDTNDIGVLWSPNRQPWVVTAYLADSPAGGQAKEAVMAQIGMLVSELAS